MASFLAKKLMNNKWLILSLVIGNILLVGIITCIPMYSASVMRRMLIKNLETYQTVKNAHPLKIELVFDTLKYEGKDEKSKAYDDFITSIMPEIISSFNLPAAIDLTEINISKIKIAPAKKRNSYPAKPLEIISMTDFNDHIDLLSGDMPSDKPIANVIECLVDQRTLVFCNLVIGETLVMTDTSKNDLPYQLKITGVFTGKDDSDFYWVNGLSDNKYRIVVSEKLMSDYIISNNLEFTATKYMLYDIYSVKSGTPQTIVKADDLYKTLYSPRTALISYTSNFKDTINTFTEQAGNLDILLWVLQIPLYVLLAFFIYMISKRVLLIEQNDLAVLVSRGASRLDIINLYLLQCGVIGLISFAIGLPLGYFICKVLGLANGFLNLVNRSNLYIEITSDAVLYGIAAILISSIIMIFPVIRLSKITIVTFKTSRVRRHKKQLWKVFFLDFICIAVSVYGLYSFYTKDEVTFHTALNITKTIDPLLFASSSLFIIGIGLFFIRLYPYVIKLIFIMFKKHWSPAGYSSLIGLIRSGGEEQFIMIFLVFTLSAGILNAKIARTINSNAEDEIRYTIGTDIVCSEEWKTNSVLELPKEMISNTGDNSSRPANKNSSDIIYVEPDFDKYLTMPEIEAASKVRTEYITLMPTPQATMQASMMSIDPATFSEVAWTREDLYDIQLNNYLNILIAKPESVILSANVQQYVNVKIGDTITLKDSTGRRSEAVVYGFFKHWPGYEENVSYYDNNMNLNVFSNFLVIGNLKNTQDMWGISPYQVWLKTRDDASINFLSSFAQQNDMTYPLYKNTESEIIKIKNNPILQGINGILTVDFIVTILICFFGFQIYWILSIKSRTLQFGIFRAMGMTKNNILSLLCIEQVLISLSAIGGGIFIGELTSELFVPFIQKSYSNDKIIPTRIITAMQDYTNIFTAIGIMLVFCIIVLVVIIARIKPTEALKLGED